LEKEAGILITSFSMLSYQGKRSDDMNLAMKRLMEVDWGLMIIDEVQLLPAKTFSTIIKEKFK
jgi:DNA excision repair protein ERCC-3